MTKRMDGLRDGWLAPRSRPVNVITVCNHQLDICICLSLGVYKVVSFVPYFFWSTDEWRAGNFFRRPFMTTATAIRHSALVLSSLHRHAFLDCPLFTGWVVDHNILVPYNDTGISFAQKWHQ